MIRSLKTGRHVILVERFEVIFPSFNKFDGILFVFEMPHEEISGSRVTRTDITLLGEVGNSFIVRSVVDNLTLGEEEDPWRGGPLARTLGEDP